MNLPEPWPLAALDICLHQILFNLHGHNHWATRTLLERCAEISPEQLDQEFEIGLGSLRKTMTHIVGAMLRWSERIAGTTLSTSIEDDGLRREPAELIRLLEIASRDLGTLAEAIEREGAWDDKVRFHLPDGLTHHFTKGAAMAHVLTHGMHHRAQAMNIRRRLALPALGLDLDVVEWEAVRTGLIK